MAIPWDFEPSVLIGCSALLGLYVWGVSRLARGDWWRLKVACFVAGDAALALALISPLDTLADHYFFSAHMAQHLLLLEFVAPLLLLSLPASLPLPGPIGRVERQLRRPMTAWAIGFGTLAVWHVPACYNAAVAHAALHVFEHLCFLVSASIFWWPVLAPRRASRMPASSSILYLFSRMAANLVLGTAIFAAPVGLYAGYGAAAAGLGWGLTPLVDQRLGGLLMWVPTLLIDICAAPLLLVLFLSPSEERHGPMSPAGTDRGASAAPGGWAGSR